MDLNNITYKGSAYEGGSEIEELLPENLFGLLTQINGFIQYGGGLHVRGLCKDPKWHSLEEIMIGELSLHEKYSEVQTTDIPFAQDCVADQYLLRNKLVYKLLSESGEVEALGFGLATFFSRVEENSQEFLGLEPLLQLHSENEYLEPGQVIHVYPPLCTAQAANGVSLKPVGVVDALGYLADLSSQIQAIEEGETFEMRIE